MFRKKTLGDYTEKQRSLSRKWFVDNKTGEHYKIIYAFSEDMFVEDSNTKYGARLKSIENHKNDLKYTLGIAIQNPFFDLLGDCLIFC